MKPYVKRMIEEHAALIEKIVKINDRIANDGAKDGVNCADFALLCLQQKGMVIYEEALFARLNNAGIDYDPIKEVYTEVVAAKSTNECFGNDFDEDKKCVNDEETNSRSNKGL